MSLMEDNSSCSYQGLLSLERNTLISSCQVSWENRQTLRRVLFSKTSLQDDFNRNRRIFDQTATSYNAGQHVDWDTSHGDWQFD